MSHDLTEYPIAETTRKVYINYLDRLDRWLKGRDVNDETLAEFVCVLFDAGKAPGSAAVALSAARWRSFCEDKPDPRGRRCKAALKNFRREGADRGRGQVDGLTWEQVDLLAALASKERTIYGCRDAAWVSIMSDGLLRISEVSAIDVAHVDFQAQTLFIPRSKTDQEGKGAELYLGEKTLAYIRTWMEKGKVNDGPLFRPIHRDFLRALKRRLGTWAIRKIIKQRCRDAGFEGRFSGHSLRVGSAQSLAQRQATLVEMQQVGRWTSPNMPAHYARKFTAQQSAMARLRYQ